MTDVFKAVQAEIKALFFARLNRGEELDCPCCGRYAKVYKRRVHKGLAAVLIAMYRQARANGGEIAYVEMPQLLRDFRAGRDFCILKYWQLVEEMPNDDPTKRMSGFWRLTPVGVDFVLGRVKIHTYAHVFDDVVSFYSGEMISLEEIGGAGFSYRELMGA